MTDEESSRHVSRVAHAVAGDEPVNWPEAASLADDARERTLIAQLRLVAGLRRGVGVSATPRPHGAVIGLWWRVPTTLAALQVLTALVSLPFVDAIGAHRLLPIQILIVVAFSLAAVTLVLGDHNDPRVRPLAYFYLFAAAALSRPMWKAVEDDVAWLFPLWRGVYPEAFLAAAAWRFARFFPGQSRFGRYDRVAELAVSAATAVGFVLFGLNLALAYIELPAVWADWLNQFAREDRSGRFWHACYFFIVSAFALIPLRARHSAPRERMRIAWFGLVLGLGMLPLVTVSFLEMISPAFVALKAAGGTPRRLIDGAVMFGLLSIPFTTSYSVLVHRVLSVQVVARRLLHTALTGYVLTAFACLPIVLVVVHAYRRRDLPLRDVFGAAETRGALFVMLFALVLLLARRLLGASTGRGLDGMRGRHTERTAELTLLIAKARTPREVARHAGDAIARALAVSPVALLLRRDNGDFEAVAGDAPLLPAHSALATILAPSAETVTLHPEGSLFPLIPEEERDWLLGSGFEVLVPLASQTAGLIGVLALGSRQDGLPLSHEDHWLLKASAGAVALALESHRTSPEAEDDVAQECSRCGHLLGGEAAACLCKAELQLARLPRTLGGKFRVIRRLGHGGMGVVYLAHDDRLKRYVALKTLPEVSGPASQAMLLEAQAMAATDHHSNLALVYELAVWRSTPVLIVEYLPGGTLSDRLVHGPLPLDAALRLTAALADALAALHHDGTLHGDIKPSNIGFTRTNVPKLLDFGLARLIHPVTSAATPLGEATAIAGTPLYLSPEIIGGHEADEYVDLWALSLVLFEALAGAHPFAADSMDDVMHRIRTNTPDIHAWRPDTPACVRDFLGDALSPRRASRPASAGVLASELRRLSAALD